MIATHGERHNVYRIEVVAGQPWSPPTHVVLRLLPPLILAGRVVDRGGVGIEGVDVACHLVNNNRDQKLAERYGEGGRGGPGVTLTPPDARADRSPLLRFMGRLDATRRARTDKDGAFSFELPPSRGHYRITGTVKLGERTEKIDSLVDREEALAKKVTIQVGISRELP